MELELTKGVDTDRINCLNTIFNLNLPKSQYERYKEHGASPVILTFIGMESRSFGTFMERVAREIFCLQKGKLSSYDHQRHGFRIEQKSSRYWTDNKWKFQHIEIKHEWDCLLLCGVDYNQLCYYITSRQTIDELINKNIITGQGRKNNYGISQPQQAYWFSISDFKKKKKGFL